MKTSFIFLVVLLGLIASRENVMAREMVHDHTSIHGGQVGMSGDFHIELVIKNRQEYVLYVTYFSRKPVDISNAKGVVIINPDGPSQEELPLTTDKVSQEFLVANGKPRKEGEEVYVSAKIELPGETALFVEFQETIGNSSGH